MRPWAIMLGGLIVWTAHFLVIWTGASVFLTTPAARWITGLATAAALGATALLARASWRDRAVAGPDRFASWSADVSLLSTLAAAIAIIWQALPALII
jgi:hypothetical protein